MLTKFIFLQNDGFTTVVILSAGKKKKRCFSNSTVLATVKKKKICSHWGKDERDDENKCFQFMFKNLFSGTWNIWLDKYNEHYSDN